jgi:NADPH2:quinone reductase
MLAGPVPSFNTARLFFKRLRVGGVAVSSYDDAQSRASWAEVVETLARSGRAPVIDSVFAFDALADAFERLRQGPLGKVLVRVA